MSEINAALDLLSDLVSLGVQVEADGDKLQFRPQEAVGLELLARLKANKNGLLAILRPVDMALDDASVTEWDDGEAPGEPCPLCNGLAVWWDAWGEEHCMQCDPPTAATRHLQSIEELRRRRGMESPEGATEFRESLETAINSTTITTRRVA